MIVCLRYVSERRKDSAVHTSHQHPVGVAFGTQADQGGGSCSGPERNRAHAVRIAMRSMQTAGIAHAPPWRSFRPNTRSPRELHLRLSVRLKGRGDVSTEHTTQGLTSLPQGGLARSSSRGSVAASSDLDALFDDKPPSHARSPSPERTSPPPAVTKRPPLPHKGGAKVRLSTLS
jgi:hypothetical protein